MNKRNFQTDAGIYDAPALEEIVVQIESGFAQSAQLEDIPELNEDDEF